MHSLTRQRQTFTRVANIQLEVNVKKTLKVTAVEANFFPFAVRANPGPGVRGRGLQVRVCPGLRVSLRGPDHLLRRPAHGGGVQQYHQRHQLEVRI